MSELLYAAYGSNLHPHRVCARVPTARLIGIGHINGHGLRFNKRGKDGSAKCNLVAATEQTHVAVYSIGIEDKSVLDLIEGLGRGYDRAMVEVSRFGRCWTYIATPDAVDDALVPFSWYKRLVMLGCEYHDFPTAYVEAIRATADEHDPVFNRRIVNLDLVGRLEQVMRNSDFTDR